MFDLLEGVLELFGELIFELLSRGLIFSDDFLLQLLQLSRC